MTEDCTEGGSSSCALDLVVGPRELQRGAPGAPAARSNVRGHDFVAAWQPGRQQDATALLGVLLDRAGITRAVAMGDVNGDSFPDIVFGTWSVLSSGRQSA